MKKNLAVELLETFDKLEESINLYQKVEKTYDMPIILDTNVRENINKIYKITLKIIEKILREKEVAYEKYDINEIILKGKNIGILTEDIYQLLISNFVQFDDLNMYQQHSVNYLIEWYNNNLDKVKIFENYIKEDWLVNWFD